ncbi:MAG: NAD-dependent epimerase/dehydratase family protein, partial [Thermoleophilia bacterium]|nr:NAD-dependent epimerase/dehydratase family protein [Thermoleophilia bacterium]
MRVLVTGGAGYIGSVIVARLAARGHDVVVYDDLSRGHSAAVPAGVLLVRGDIRDGGLLRETLIDAGCDAVVHMAALAEVAESVAEPERYHSVNVDGTANVLRAAEATGVRRVIVTSSAAAVGHTRGLKPVDESVRFNYDQHLTPYGHSKFLAEAEVYRAIRRGLD